MPKKPIISKGMLYMPSVKKRERAQNNVKDCKAWRRQKMSDDIVKRLRECSTVEIPNAFHAMREAADEIERMRLEIDTLGEMVDRRRDEMERLREAKTRALKLADERAKDANDFSVRLARADAEIMRLREARSRALWLPIETAPKWEEIEKRGIYKDGGDGLFFFSATHWRPICNDASKAKTDT